jgi:hypothetical protein
VKSAGSRPELSAVGPESLESNEVFADFWVRVLFIYTGADVVEGAL